MTNAIDTRPAQSSSPLAPARPPQSHIPTAELVECTCPDACERDHDRD